MEPINNEEQAKMETRREFLQAAKGWSGAVAALVAGVALSTRPAQAGGWYVGGRGGGAGWVNNRGWGGGGGAWVNNRGWNGGGWVNGVHTGWANGGGWSNGGGWVNGGLSGGWLNGGAGGWVNSRNGSAVVF